MAPGVPQGPPEKSGYFGSFLAFYPILKLFEHFRSFSYPNITMFDHLEPFENCLNAPECVFQKVGFITYAGLVITKIFKFLFGGLRGS